MTRNDRQNPRAGSRLERNRGEPRLSHSIRFSDSEWSLIEQAADRQGLAAGELVRSSVLALVEDRLDNPPASLSSGHVALIEATYCAVHMLSALATGQMRYQVIDRLADAAHNAMLETMKQEPVRAVPDRSPSPTRQQRDDEARHVPGRSPRFFHL